MGLDLNKKDKEIIAAAQEQYDRFVPPKSGKERLPSLWKQVTDKLEELDRGETYLSEWSSFAKGDQISIARALMSNSRTVMNEIRLGPNPDNYHEWKTTRSDDEKWDEIKKAERRANRAEQFLNYDHPPKKVDWDDVMLDSEYEDERNFTGCAWIAYFLYYPPYDAKQEAVLGKALVKIEEFDEVIFENTGAEGSVDYTGSYIPYNDMDEGIIIFDLDAERIKWGRNLHIKLYIEHRKQEIALGMFVTYEHGRIQSGRILFERVNPNTIKQNDSISSYIKNSPQFKKIDPRITEFFSSRKNNYQLLREDIRSLESFKHRYKRWPSNSRFLELFQPKIFISYPVSGNAGTYSSEFAKTIKKDIEDLFPKTFVHCFTNTDDHIKGNRNKVFDDIAELKQTKIFVFFSNGVEKISYSYIWLGWALAFCKHVIVIGKRGDFSETLHHLKHETLEYIEIEDDVQSEWEKGMKQDALPYRLQKHIAEHLPKRLDGNMKI